MTIDKIHDLIRDLLNKQQKGWSSPGQIDTALDRGQMSVFNDYAPIYALNQESQDALSPFKRSLPFGTDVNGVYAIPGSENYQALLGIGIQYTDGSHGTRRSKLKLVTEDEFDERSDSQLRKPTLTHPIGQITGLGAFQLFPAGVYAGTVRFLRRPLAPRYDYTQVGRVITYNAGAPTQQLEWAERYQAKIIYNALELLGVTLGEDEVIKVSQALKNNIS